MAILVVHGWHSECGGCGYGSGGWADSPALEEKPILTPESTKCHGCGEEFTEIQDMYGKPFEGDFEDDEV